MTDLNQTLSDDAYWNDLYRKSVPNAIQRIEEISKLLATLTPTLITLYVGVILFNANTHFIIHNGRWIGFLLPILCWGASLLVAISPAIPDYHQLDGNLEVHAAIKQVFETSLRTRRRAVRWAFGLLAAGIFLMVIAIILYFLMLAQDPTLIDSCPFLVNCQP